ncbi:hypothetical protein TrVE_jg9529 [Triparma verrucosa]|uniref:NADP-dependent oxidoreductase domain-containing protein n=1 Tax=Triparma verrucosa TaxID=1606542 RepID=A0A9W7EZQ9_9STRA|nr:hypothetical protein TrVE_jg9529 [Triparma verrucosa]
MRFQLSAVVCAALFTIGTSFIHTPLKAPLNTKKGLCLSQTPSDDSGGDSTSEEDGGLSFEEQIKRLNSQFNVGDDNGEGGNDDESKESAIQPPLSTSSTSKNEPFTLSSITSQAKQKGFSIDGDMAASTAYWGDAKRGFTMKNLPRSKSKGTHNPGDLSLTYSDLLKSGVTFLSAGEDESMSEELLGFFDSQNRLDTTAKVATSYVPKPFIVRKDRTTELNPRAKKAGILSMLQLRFGSGSVLNALQKSCDRLGVGYVDLYQADFSGGSKSKPFYVGGKSAVVEGLKLCKQRGLCNNVGVKGVKGKAAEKAIKLFEKKGIKMDALEVDFSLVDRTALTDGTLDACKRNGVVCIATQPLGLDEIGSGKFTAMNPTGGMMGKPRFAFKELDELLEIHNALKFVSQKVRQRLKNDWDADREAQKKKGKKIDINDVFPMEITTSQVALNYVIAKGAVPLFNAVSAQDAQEFAKAKEWKLKGDELELLEEAAAKCEKR